MSMQYYSYVITFVIRLLKKLLSKQNAAKLTCFKAMLPRDFVVEIKTLLLFLLNMLHYIHMKL